MLAMGPTVDHRAPQALVQAEQVMRMALDRRELFLVQEPAKNGEIVFLIVDGVFGTRRCGPCERGIARLLRLSLE